MPRTNYQRGADKERRIMNTFRKDGFTALRSAGSHSPIDVVAINPNFNIIKLIQSKSPNISNAEKNRILKEGEKFNGIFEVQFELWD